MWLAPFSNSDSNSDSNSEIFYKFFLLILIKCFGPFHLEFCFEKRFDRQIVDDLICDDREFFVIFYVVSDFRAQKSLEIALQSNFVHNRNPKKKNFVKIRYLKPKVNKNIWKNSFARFHKLSGLIEKVQYDLKFNTFSCDEFHY